jgi:hypothetical protein
MFYSAQTSGALRFGDIVTGFVSTTPVIRAPFVSTLPDAYNVEVTQPRFSVVLSPCCSISNKTISLTPLVQVRAALLKNPYFREDLTRINRQMSPEQAVPPEVWEKLDQEEKQKRLHEGITYAFGELFVYAGHDILPKYHVHRKEGSFEINTYMIDFQAAHKVDCEKIVTPVNSPLEAKCLELSRETRAQLRDKIAAYFTRVPREELSMQD